MTDSQLIRAHIDSCEECRRVERGESDFCSCRIFLESEPREETFECECCGMILREFEIDEEAEEILCSDCAELSDYGRGMKHYRIHGDC